MQHAPAAAKLGHARGGGLVVVSRGGRDAAEHAPAGAKRTVAGGGRAHKNQVAQMVKVLLGLGEVPQADAAYALAIAITHLQRAPWAAPKAPAAIKKASPLRAVTPKV